MLEFQAIAWHGEDVDFPEEADGGGDESKRNAAAGDDVDDDDETSSNSTTSSSEKKKTKKVQASSSSSSPPYKTLQYVIKVFGRRADGESASLTVRGFRPFFYVKVSDDFTATDKDNFVHLVKNQMSQRCFQNLGDCELVQRQDLWGFTNRKMFKFLKFNFLSCRFMKYAAKFFADRDVPWKGRQQRFVVYESNVEPYIRFMHQRGITPCGWISVKKYDADPDVLRAKTRHDCEAYHAHVRPRRQGDAGEEFKDAKFVVMSFDLECMSISGDFPVPKKDFSKLAGCLHDAVKKWSRTLPNYDVHARAARLVARSIGAEKHVRPEDAEASAELDRMSVPVCTFACPVQAEALLGTIVQGMDDFLAIVNKKRPPSAATPTTQAAATTTPKTQAAVTTTPKTPTPTPTQATPTPVGGDEGTKRKVSQETLDDEERSRKIFEMSKLFSRTLPKLAGDPIIQIGATFHLHGDPAVTERHIFTLGSCDGLSDPAAEVVACKDEREVIMRFAKLVSDRDPDVVTGYNIFGFDMRYIEERARELSSCYSTAMKSLNRLADREAKYEERSLSSSALGDNKLYLIDMIGRVPIDMMKVAQRDHKLDSYKLDEVAHKFLGERKNDVSPKEIFR